MESLFNKYRLQTLCVIVASLIVAVAAAAVTYMVPQKTSAYADAAVTTEENRHYKMIDVTIKADGNTMQLMAAETTVGDILESYNIKLGEHDEITPAKDEAAYNDMEIVIKRVEYKEETVKEDTPYKTKTKGVNDLPQGTSRVAVEGQKGQDEVTYKVKYEDGKKVSKEEVSRKTIKEPVTEVIEKSTVGTIKGKEYSKKFTVKAYSYTGGGTTASGKPAAVGRIAVDPRVIPLGTKVYVEGYGFAEAADTGGNIKGNTIDVYFNSTGQCRQWGVRNITIYILK